MPVLLLFGAELGVTVWASVKPLRPIDLTPLCAISLLKQRRAVGRT